MANRIVIRDEAESDLDEAYAWYEEQREGLGDEFLACVRQCFRLIGLRPALHPMVHRHFRRALVKRFPYVVFYHVDRRVVTIHAVFHQARDPKIWSKRLG